MIRIAIVEDEKEYQQKLSQDLDRFAQEQRVEIAISMFEDGLDLVDGYGGGFDIILMDIKMKHMDGMEAAKAIRRVDSAVVIIFITSMAQYAIAGYEVDALDFVIKPVEYPQFEIKMKKAMRVVEKISRNKFLMLSRDGRKEKVSTDDLLYVEVKGHNLYFVTPYAVYVQRSSMADVERELEGYHFARCNQSYLVNLKNITCVDKDDVQVGNHRLPFSRSKKKQFLKELTTYLEAGYS